MISGEKSMLSWVSTTGKMGSRMKKSGKVPYAFWLSTTSRRWPAAVLARAFVMVAIVSFAFIDAMAMASYQGFDHRKVLDQRGNAKTSSSSGHNAGSSGSNKLPWSYLTSSKPCPPPDFASNGSAVQIPANQFSEAMYRDVEEVRFVSYQGKVKGETGVVGSGDEKMLKVCKIRCEGGKWVGPTCTPFSDDVEPDPFLNGCEVPSEPSNVLFTYNNKPIKDYPDSLIPEGSLIFARCQLVGNFQFVGDKVLQCTRGGWIGEIPRCISTNTILNFSGPAPPTIQYNVPTGTWAIAADGSLWLYPDTNAHLDCIYARTNGTPTWTWINTGIERLKTIEVVKEFQLPKDYPPRDYPRGWALSPRERHWRYRLSLFHPKEEDSGVFTCTTPEGYSNSIEVNIAAVSCGALNPLDPHLEIHVEEDPRLKSVANFSCPVGYTLVGDSSLVCLPNEWNAPGNWSGNVPRCLPVRCPPLDVRNMEPLGITTYNDSYKGSVVFHCPTGYRLRGSVEVQCTQDGIWSGTLPTCQEVECPHPLPPLNGKVIEQRHYKVGTMVKYVCDQGHVIMGQPVLICQSDGTWSAPPPYCSIGCPYPEISLNNGQFSPIKFFYHPGDSVLVTCQPGFALSDEKKDKLICNALGKWFGETGDCLLVPTEPGPVYYYDDYTEEDEEEEAGNEVDDKHQQKTVKEENSDKVLAD